VRGVRMTDIGQRILSARKAAQSDEERIRRFETGKRPRGQRILSARKAAQWDEERIRRFKEEQRRKREWISFVEIAEWYLDLIGPAEPKTAGAVRERAYQMLESDLLVEFLRKTAVRVVCSSCTPGSASLTGK
jgi:hypothetical protein